MSHPPHDPATPRSDDPPNLLKPDYTIPLSDFAPVVSPELQDLLAASSLVAQHLQAQSLAAYSGQPLPYDPAVLAYMLTGLAQGWINEVGKRHSPPDLAGYDPSELAALWRDAYQETWQRLWRERFTR